MSFLPSMYLYLLARGFSQSHVAYICQWSGMMLVTGRDHCERHHVAAVTRPPAMLSCAHLRELSSANIIFLDSFIMTSINRQWWLWDFSPLLLYQVIHVFVQSSLQLFFNYYLTLMPSAAIFK